MDGNWEVIKLERNVMNDILLNNLMVLVSVEVVSFLPFSPYSSLTVIIPMDLLNDI